ncbi:MAG: hypothetical protein HOL66_08020 [Rhodospirillaceae bacterium]|jgi:hypothetical protein|nr:hypothetical protein [Rhodospirillaceae bacterium]MBT5244177.1 hypothetical protein [Rhodospirillaceae bacterium]MBT6243141.1 hypothetical protein [Rhodospirillaceae bacterium]MBT7137466.1 hypothetical protein [Rhodospirillaceae bacterium]
MAVNGQQETVETLSERDVSSSIDEYLPVFRGLDDISISGKKIAAIAGVTPSTFSRWRAGWARVPECKLVLLTLLLAHWIDELEALSDNRDLRPRSRVETRLNTTRRCLFQQEVINQTLPPETVREGSHLFRAWWFQEGALRTKAPENASWNESLHE